MESKIIRIIYIPGVTIFLLSVILFIDYIGVNIVNNNGLVFEIHCYSFGLTFWMTSLIFGLLFYKFEFFSNKTSIIISSLVAGALWWLLTFYVIMNGFHGSIGGTY